MLTVFVAVHELGHYAAGRLLGFGILEYAIGMGPVVWKTEKKGIQYSLRALPLGGMCRFYGEDDNLPVKQDAPLPFNAQKPWKRAVVVAAGPLMNVVLAVVLAAFALGIFGDVAAQVQEFSFADSPAQQAGMQVGDMLYAVDGKRLLSYAEAAPAIQAADPEAVTITVLRDGEKLDLTIRDIYNQEAGYNLIGITFSPARRTYGVLEAMGDSFGYVWNIVREMITAIGQMFSTGVQEGDLMGPVGTISVMSEFVRYGWETILRLGVLITINLGLLNLFPIPGLDGGRLVFVALEGIRGKAIPPEKEGMIHFAGLILLFVLVILLTVQDVRALLGF